MALTTKQIDEFWRLADANNDGKLTVQELARAVRKYDKNVSDAAIAVSILLSLSIHCIPVSDVFTQMNTFNGR
jgi:hypothetical protein